MTEHTEHCLKRQKYGDGECECLPSAGFKRKKVKMNWHTIDLAPKDGTEFVVCNLNQGGVKTLVSWNTIHGYWQSKGNYYYMQDTHCFLLPEVPN